MVRELAFALYHEALIVSKTSAQEKSSRSPILDKIQACPTALALACPTEQVAGMLSPQA